MTDNHRILTYFVPGSSQDEELLAWVKQNGRRNLSDFGREAFACLRQVQSHAAAAGLSWQEWIEAVSQPCFCCRENNGCWPGCGCGVNVQPESEE